MTIKIKTNNKLERFITTERLVEVPDGLTAEEIEEFIYENQLHSIWYKHPKDLVSDERTIRDKGDYTDETFEIIEEDEHVQNGSGEYVCQECGETANMEDWCFKCKEYIISMTKYDWNNDKK